MNLEPDAATLRLMMACEISDLVCMGYSVRAASLAMGIPPSTGRRYLQRWNFLLTHRAEPSDPDDRPF